LRATMVAAAPMKDEGGGISQQYEAPSEGKPKYREPEFVTGPCNIMYDKRVIRGNTYAAQILPAALPAEETMRSTKRSRPFASSKPPGTPDAVEGRRHIDVQTDQYLEELTDTVPEADTTTQTDAFMDRPPTPLFIPVKVGVDVETQIEAGDLFDFDFEVEPILEVLVGKTLEQGLMEVMEEEELAAMRAHQEHFEQIRNAELVATQRMEAAEKRKMEEKERRVAQEKARVEREKVVREKVAAQTFARGYLSGLVGTVFDKLYEAGVFYDPVEKEVKGEFMEWLSGATVAEVAKQSTARQCVEALIQKALKLNAEQKEAAEAERQKKLEEEKAAAAAAAAAAEAAAKEVAEKRAAALKILLYGDAAIVAADAVEAAKAALTPPAPEAPAEGEEAPPAPAPPSDEAILQKLIEDGTCASEAVEEAIAAAANPAAAAE